MVEHDRFTGLRVRRDGNEWNRKITEIANGVNVPRQAGEQLGDPLPLDDPAG